MRYFLKIIMFGTCLQGCSAVCAPPTAEGQPKESYFSAKNRFFATSGAVVATPIFFALREATLKALANTPQNKDKEKYYQALAKNFYKNTASTALWKKHFLRLSAVIACFSKRAPKETHRAWALRTQGALTRYAKENPIHATVLALWTANVVVTTLHIGYKTSSATTQGIKQWINAFTVSSYKKTKTAAPQAPVALDFTSTPEEAAADTTTPNPGNTHAGKKTSETKVPDPAEEMRKHATREKVRAWLKTIQAHPLGTHALAALAAESAHPYANDLYTSFRDQTYTDEVWLYSRMAMHIAMLPVHVLAHIDPENDMHVDAIINFAHKVTRAGTKPINLVIGTVKGTWRAGKWLVYDVPVACGSGSKRSATRMWNALLTKVGWKTKQD